MFAKAEVEDYPEPLSLIIHETNTRDQGRTATLPNLDAVFTEAEVTELEGTPCRRRLRDKLPAVVEQLHGDRFGRSSIEVLDGAAQSAERTGGHLRHRHQVHQDHKNAYLKQLFHTLLLIAMLF